MIVLYIYIYIYIYRGGYRRVRGYTSIYYNRDGDDNDAYINDLSRKLSIAIANSDELFSAAAAASASNQTKKQAQSPPAYASLASGKIGIDERTKSIVLSLDAAYKEVLDAFDGAPCVEAFFQETKLVPDDCLDCTFSLAADDCAMPRGIYILSQS